MGGAGDGEFSSLRNAGAGTSRNPQGGCPVGHQPRVWAKTWVQVLPYHFLAVQVTAPVIWFPQWLNGKNTPYLTELLKELNSTEYVEMFNRVYSHRSWITYSHIQQACVMYLLCTWKIVSTQLVY